MRYELITLSNADGVLVRARADLTYFFAERIRSLGWGHDADLRAVMDERFGPDLDLDEIRNAGTAAALIVTDEELCAGKEPTIPPLPDFLDRRRHPQ